MPKGTIDIKRRIKSINNTKKVTKAMELVSAAKMRRAIAAVSATRPYAKYAWDMISKLAPKADKKINGLLKERTVKKVGLVLISSNRGLCGGFNNNIANKAIQLIKKETGAQSFEVMTFGKKSRDIIARSNYKIVADFIKQDITRSVTEISPLVFTIVNGYIEEKFDKVYLVYNEFISTMRQVVSYKQLLPLGKIEEQKGSEVKEDDFTYEPNAEEVLNYLLPKLIEMQIYQAVLESEASEHSARMLSMRNATDAATDILFELNLTYNQARQAGITQEIAEISAGRAALE